MASALGERAASWSEGDKDKAKKTQSSPSPSLTPVPEKHKNKDKDYKKLPAPPPHHPTITAGHAPVKHSVPPPLPKRSDVRRQPSPTKPTAEVDSTEAAEPPIIIEAKETPVLSQSPTSTQPPPPRSPYRSNTPSNVPLPESRPQTPVIVPSASGTPAGAAPPPLPRRAAARAVRPGGSRPVTPAPILESMETPSDAKAPETPTLESPAVQTEDASPPELVQNNPGKEEIIADGNLAPDLSPVLESPDTTALDQAPDAVAEAESSSSSSAPEEVFVDAETEIDGEQKGVEAKGEEKVKAEINGALDVETTADNNVSSVDETEESKIEGVAEGSKEGEALIERDVSAKEADREEVKAAEGHNAQQAQGDGVKENKVDEDKDVYIGDATWEERTWKELVRLREEMFWARVGAIRP
jgi:hypothetical protein